ncbi:hypothetical protein POM88_049248 [Heracleum sosnowskyi]|uniref:SKP1-like protein n=1 Tax=Heracleum sosnowskyi TaxID=360622 RepID=A0AAD8GXE3_9APIA|nr:hypothetical protein POM88_049248 [Heracleum sosnowskyi]
MITLKSSDNEIFEVEKVVAIESQKIKQMIEDDWTKTTIPLSDIPSKILVKVIEYCKKHVESSKAGVANKDVEDDLKSFDAHFLKVHDTTLFHLVFAANYLNIKSLLDLTLKQAAEILRRRRLEEFREIYEHLE